MLSSSAVSVATQTPAITPDGVSDYDYDQTDQLVDAEYDFQEDESYLYDDNGNRLNDGYVTGENNQLLSDGTYDYEYDAEGNRVKQTEIATGNVTEYEWDYRNRLVAVVTSDSDGNVISNSDYTYDAFNKRIAKSVDADGAGAGVAIVERFVYDGDHIALTFDGLGNLIERFFHGTEVDQVIAQENAGGEVLWALADHQGSMKMLLNNEGNVVNNITYDAFGGITIETNPNVKFRFGYTGREHDEETGLRYHRRRYVVDNVFISQDPIGFGGGDTNLYRYVGNNPTNATDSSGLFSITDLMPAWAKKALGSDPGVYTNLHPETPRENPYQEEMRQWTLNTVKQNSKLICELGKRYNIPPEAIAGVILWEGVENPYNLLRGQGPLFFTKPGAFNSFGIPGKIHLGPNDIVLAPEAQDRVRQRRPDAFEPFEFEIEGSNGKTLAVPYGLNSLEARLTNDPSLAIEFSGAIIDVLAEQFEKEAAATRQRIGSSLGNYNIRNQAGLLSSFFQGVSTVNGAVAFETRRFNENPNSRPRLPRADASMGPWVSQYRDWISEFLEDCECEK